MLRKARKVPLWELEPRRIALIKPSALGDIVHGLPVLTALRRRYPSAHITWIVNRAYESLLFAHPDLDDTLPFDRNMVRQGIFRATREFSRFWRLLRARRFDLAVDLQGLFRTGVMSLATGAPRRLGLSCAREGARWFYTDLAAVADPQNMHAVDRNWAAAEALGAADGEKCFRLHIEESADLWALERLRDLPRPWLAVGAGARWITKRWLPQHFAELVQRAQACFGGTAIFVGTADEVPLAQTTADLLTGRTLLLAGQTTLPQLAALFKRVDVAIINDTGPLHLAVALGRPVVAPYTCTQVKQNGPYGQAHRAVETSVWCRGSYLTTCSRLECMPELTPDRLWPILREILQSWQSRCLSA